MLGVDPEIGTSALRLWVTAGSAALLFLFCMLALFRSQASLPWRLGLVLLGAVFGAAIAWASLDHSASGNSSPDRRALEHRLDELGALALAPGSPLACLDALAGENVEAACEKALFVSPANVAAASSYVAARLTLLANMTAYAEHGGADIQPALVRLRRSLEADHFGFVAQVLTIRDGCTSQNCKTLALLRDPSRVQSNLGARALDRYLDHYQDVWAKAADGAPAEVVQAQPNAPGPRKLVNIDFPSAASIPPVSIMNPEPSGPVLPGVAAAAATNPNPQAVAPASRRSRKQAANPPPPTVVQPAPTGSAATEPIWPEPVPPPPPQTAAAPAGAPVQLSPPSPSASAGGAVRAQ